MIEERKYPKIAQQEWDEVYFMHWKVAPEKLAAYIPKPFELDLFDGYAWLTAVSFLAKHSRLRFIPFDFVRRAIQTNLRTYVKLPHHKEPGVYFLKTFLNHRFASFSARELFHLPFQYMEADFVEENKKSTFINRVDGEKILHLSFVAQDEAAEEEQASFLTERYAIWNVQANRIIKIPILHDPWTINEAEVLTRENKLHPLIRDVEPDIVHYGGRKLSYLYPYERIGFFT